MAARNSKQQLCIVTLGCHRFLLPQPDALKVIDIMSRAAQVATNYTDDGFKYTVGEAVDAELTVVRPGQLVMPQAEATPSASRARRKSTPQLEHNPIRLLGDF
ncbi:hypothetical protein [Pseudomonas citronellolis]|uniref:hypothetical protein n=1 Tax=Pseudomonas citronellolis TaxID=53408 RepID=UPI0020A15959|nr:hypothetical protein [Pseudomonas citronellolis]MCP1606435.1 hypothetical protein [Pseudomonas citronellolis]MCP1657141.1 hypothetical protein [Pseudomonas citronellolis]MCP1724126.1 hypothetical protein [Pseudomonas citronellolis]